MATSSSTGNTSADANLKIKITTEVDSAQFDKLKQSLNNLSSETGEQLSQAASGNADGGVVDLIESASEAAEDFGESMQSAGARGAASATKVAQSVGTIRSAVNTATKAWEAFASAAGKAFGVIGLIQQIIGAIQQVYEFLTRAEREREEAAKQAAEEEKRLAEQIIKDAATETIKERQKSQLDAIYTHYKDITDELRRQLELTQRRLDLEQGLDDQESEQQRLIARAAHARGELTDDQLAQRLDEIDLSANARRRARREQQAQEQLDAAIKQEDNAREANAKAVAARDQFVNPRIMTAEEYASNNRSINDLREKIKGLIDQRDDELSLTEPLKHIDPIGYKERRQEIRNQYGELIQELNQQLVNKQGIKNSTIEGLYARNPEIDINSPQEIINALNSYATTLQGLNKAVETTGQELEKASQAVNNFEENLTGVQRMNDAQEKTDWVREQLTNDERDAAARAKEQKEQEAQAAQKVADELNSLSDQISTTRQNLTDAQRASAAANRDVTSQATAARTRLAGDNQLRANTRADMQRDVDFAMGMVNNDGQVDNAEASQLRAMIAEYQNSTSGTQESRNMIINFLQTILNQLAASQAQERVFQQKLTALQQQYKTMQQHQRNLINGRQL